MPPRKRTYNSPPAMGGDSSKRVRFGSDDEDDNLVDAAELDFPNRKARRGAVKDTEGYHSDSSNEDDETMIKRNSATNAMDEEDDMFGGDEPPTSGKAGPDGINAKDNDTRVKDTGLQLKGDAGKGGKEFLDLGDIEGQEFDDRESDAARTQREAVEQAKKVTEDEIDYISGDEKANDDDAVVSKERKSATGMGFAMSSFNMKEEMSEGRFTADGSYQAASKDPDAVYDNWLTAVTTKDIEIAQKAKERQDALFKARSEQLAASSMSRIDCLKALVEGLGGLVKPGETVQAALARLGKARKEENEAEKERLKKEKRKQKSTAPKKDFDAPDNPATQHAPSSSSAEKTERQDMDLDPLTPHNPSASSIVKGKGKATDSTSSSDSPTKVAIDRLTTLASTLLGVHGETDIYEETYEGIIRQLIAEGEVPRGWEPKNEDILSETQPGNGVDAVKEVEEKPQRKGVISRPLISRPKA